MKISRLWLSDFVEWTEKDPQVIADRMTRCMGEVDEVEEQGRFLDRCIVGKVASVEKHPDADKLTVCRVETGKGTVQVVCGGTNVRAGMLVAFAPVGATVKWHGGDVMTLAKVKLRGVESEGMICAGEELEIDALFPPKKEDGERPVVDLSRFETQDSKFSVGTPLKKALGLDDVIFHIDNHAITHRPDLFSHVGIARELVAMGLAKAKKTSGSPVKPGKRPAFPKTSIPFERINDIEKIVPRSFSCCIDLPSIPATPDWMVQRLTATGWRPINLIVDITNYVMMETGMPLHSFDAADISGTVHTRLSRAGESIVTLDGAKRNLPEGAIVLSDDRGVFDLMGIMGGLRSSTKATTKKIYLHSMVVDPSVIRRAVNLMGLRTDAATVYEKGIQNITAEEGFFRALELILALVPDATISSVLAWEGKDTKKKPIICSIDALSSRLGIAVKPAEAQRILRDLGCEVKTAGKKMTVTPPLWRKDLSSAEDISEEVGRIHGYANIPPAMPEASITPPERDTRLHGIRDSLSEAGAFEALHLAFTNPKQCAQWKLPVEGGLRIENPIGEELSMMRMCLVPSLIETAVRELRNTSEHTVKMYENGHTFSRHGEKNAFVLSIVERSKGSIKDSPLLRAKADILRALNVIGYAPTVVKAKPTMPYAHAGRSAEIICKGVTVGALFEIHPLIAADLGLKGRAAVAMLDLDALFAVTPDTKIIAALPAFPSVTLDVTLPLSDDAVHSDLIKNLRAKDPLLTNVSVVDLYEKDTNRTITLRFTYRSPERTLTQAEVEKAHTKVMAGIRT